MRILSFIAIFLMSSALANRHKKNEDKKINIRAIVQKVNGNPSSLWKADTYQTDEISMREIRGRLGARLRKNERPSSNELPESKFSAQNKPQLKWVTDLPRFYDARQDYPECDSISHIRDQSDCGSCWAVSAASVLSDRMCIRSKGRYNYELSSRFITACDKKNYGCSGGYFEYVWEFLEKNGTVSGGEFQSDEGCQPYPFHPCGWPNELPCHWYMTPKCLKNECENEEYSFTHEKHIVKASTSYRVRDPLPTSNEYYMRQEIYLNGPVQAGIDIFEDFLTYKSGIYEQTTNEYVGGHAVKIIGWGEENGVKYWIVANSWGTSWGEDGTFRIISSGPGSCGIQYYVYAGIPELDEY